MCETTLVTAVMYFFTARQYSVGFEVVTVSVVGDPWSPWVPEEVQW